MPPSGGATPVPGRPVGQQPLESDIQVDPTNPRHLIGSTNGSPPLRLNTPGFYESSEGEKRGPSGSIPVTRAGPTDTDPVGASTFRNIMS